METTPVNSQIASEIETAYIESINAQSSATLYLMAKRGPIRDTYLTFLDAFLRVYLYTSSLSDVSKRLNDNTLNEKILKWLNSKIINTDGLAAGIALHRQYINILQDSGAVSYRKG